MGTHKYYWLEYKCERCGTKDQTSSQGSQKGLEKLIPRCKLCNRKLCGNCYHYELCTEHWEPLSSRSKHAIETFVAGSRKRQKISGILIVIVIGWNLAEFFKNLDHNPSTFFGVPAWVLNLAALGLLIFYALWQEKARIKTVHEIIDSDPSSKNPVPVEKIQEKALKALVENALSDAIASPAGFQPASSAPVQQGLAPTKKCNACGHPNELSGKYCLKCGAALPAGPDAGGIPAAVLSAYSVPGQPINALAMIPCPKCGKRRAGVTFWHCEKCGRWLCMGCTFKSSRYGGMCKDCLPTLSPFQQQLMQAEAKTNDGYRKKGLGFFITGFLMLVPMVLVMMFSGPFVLIPELFFIVGGIALLALILFFVFLCLAVKFLKKYNTARPAVVYPLPEDAVGMQQQAAMATGGIKPPAGTKPPAGSSQAQATAFQSGSVVERPGGFLQEGKWVNGTITFGPGGLSFASKKDSLTIATADIVHATKGDKNNILLVHLRNGDIKTFRMFKPETFAEKMLPYFKQ